MPYSETQFQEVHDKRNTAWAKAREIADLAVTEARALTTDEQTAWGKAIADTDLHAASIDRMREIDLRASHFEESEGTVAGQQNSDPENRENAAHQDGEDIEWRAMKKYWKDGHKFLNDEEVRALQADSAEAGGYTVPRDFGETLIEAKQDIVWMRQISTVMPLETGDSIGFPSLDADPADADWTAEIATTPRDTTMDFGAREMVPHKLSKEILVSNKLLRVSAVPIEELISRKFAYKFSVTEEKAFLTGTGAQQPLGIFVATANGISTGRDEATDNTTTAITFDNLINNKYNLKPQYWTAARWIFHRDAVKQISKLQDGDGAYIWRVSVRVGEPDTILGHPLMTSEYTPNTFTAGLYVGMFGDFANYWIADGLNFSIQRLNELYARTDQVGFIGRAWTDGAPVLEEAFSRVTLAAS